MDKSFKEKFRDLSCPMILTISFILVVAGIVIIPLEIIPYNQNITLILWLVSFGFPAIYYGAQELIKAIKDRKG